MKHAADHSTTRSSITHRKASAPTRRSGGTSSRKHSESLANVPSNRDLNSIADFQFLHLVQQGFIVDLQEIRGLPPVPSRRLQRGKNYAGLSIHSELIDPIQHVRRRSSQGSAIGTLFKAVYEILGTDWQSWVKTFISKSRIA